MAIPITQPASRDKKFPTGILILLIIAAAFGGIAFLIFLRPELAPPADLLDRVLPKGSAIRELEAIDLNIESVTNHTVFKTLKEIGTVPIELPQTGKANPFY